MYAGFSQFGPALAGVVGTAKLQLVGARAGAWSGVSGASWPRCCDAGQG
jgi:hypothetical protein